MIPASQHNIKMECSQCGEKIDLVKDEAFLRDVGLPECEKCHNKLWKVSDDL